MVFDIVSHLRTDNSRLFKENVVNLHKDNNIFKTVLYYTLSPRIQYYIKKIPKYICEGSLSPDFEDVQTTYSRIFDFLDDLHYRRVTGNNAINQLSELMSSLTKNDAEILQLIIQRDLKCGINTSTVNKVFPGLIEETPYMRVSLLKEMKKDNIDWSSGLYSQEKLDGMFANIIISSSSQVLSRNGTCFPLEPFSHILKELKLCCVDNIVFHGELVVYQGEDILKREVGNGILNSLLKTGEFDCNTYRIHFITWDVLPLLKWQQGVYNREYKSRYNDLVQFISDNTRHVSIVPTIVVYSFDQAKQHYIKLAAEGKEGTILKDPCSIWKDHTSKQMWKFKVEADVELRVVGWTKGNGKNKDLFGSITCASEDLELEVNVSGFTDNHREHIWNNLDLYNNAIMTVTFNSIMKSEGKKASLFLPRWSDWRFDKSKANTLQEIEDIFESVLV